MIKARLKHATIGQPAYGLNVPASEYKAEGVRLLRTTDISDDGHLAEEISPVFVDARVAMEARLREGDLLISRSGTVGRSYLHDGAIAATYAGYLVRFRPRSGVMPRFLFYWTKSKGFADQVQLEGTQSTIVNVNAQKYANMSLPLPSPDTQVAITDFLDRETERIDQLVEKKQRLVELLEEKRTALISHAVTKGLDPTVPMKDSGIPWLGEIPAHWDALPIRRVAHFANSNVDKKTIDGEIPVLLCNYTDVYYGSYLDTTEGFMEATATPEEIRKFHLRVGTVLVTKDSETADDIGIPAYVSRELDAVCGYHLTVLTPYRHRLRGDFLYWTLESASLRAAFETTAKGVTRYGLTLDGIGSTIVPAPPLTEQGKIAELLRKHDLRSEKAIDQITAQIDKLAEYRQALITAAVTGQIDVTTEAPEPEEVVA